MLRGQTKVKSLTGLTGGSDHSGVLTGFSTIRSTNFCGTRELGGINMSRPSKRYSLEFKPVTSIVVFLTSTRRSSMEHVSGSGPKGRTNSSSSLVRGQSSSIVQPNAAQTFWISESLAVKLSFSQNKCLRRMRGSADPHSRRSC